MTIPHGLCDPAFALVRDAFVDNFASAGEVGAGVCVIVDGRPVVDLWAGWADRDAGRLWERDTLTLVWSCTKGAVALCAHHLARHGRLDFDRPVRDYWPEFAARGKGDIPVRWLLDHQAGLPALRLPLAPGAVYDWDAMTAALADESPFWEPGTRSGYHATTFGHLVGEVVRRIDGRSIGHYFRDEIAGPHSLDFHIGLPASEHHRVAPTLRADPTPAGETPWRFLVEAQRDPAGVQALVVRNTGRRPGFRDHDTPAAYEAQLPSQGGLANARSLAGLYASLPAAFDADAIARMGRVGSASACDATLLVGLRWGLGFMRSSDNRSSPPGQRDSVILGAAAFGHAGMGGSLGFYDPTHRLAFGYAMNKQGRGVLLNPRGQRLVDAMYRALGCRSHATGDWR